MIPTTETLLKGLAAGNEGRWARFYRDYAPFLENTILAKCPSLSFADAEEIVSDTLIDIAKLMPTYTYDKATKGTFLSLLAKIAQNKAIDRLKKENRHTDLVKAFAVEPLAISREDWRRERYAIALRRVLVDEVQKLEAEFPDGL